MSENIKKCTLKLLKMPVLNATRGSSEAVPAIPNSCFRSFITFSSIKTRPTQRLPRCSAINSCPFSELRLTTSVLSSQAHWFPPLQLPSHNLKSRSLYPIFTAPLSKRLNGSSGGWTNPPVPWIPSPQSWLKLTLTPLVLLSPMSSTSLYNLDMFRQLSKKPLSLTSWRSQPWTQKIWVATGWSPTSHFLQKYWRR